MEQGPGPSTLGTYQRWAPALFSRFCAFALASAKPKKERESAKKKEREKKAKAPSAKEKKREFALFLATHSGNPVSEPKAARQGGKQES